MTNPAQIAATLEALAAKATPGPWIAVRLANVVLKRTITGNFTDELTSYTIADDGLLLALRNNLPTIIAALKAMEEQTDGE